jgi:hypothetical protein
MKNSKSANMEVLEEKKDQIKAIRKINRNRAIGFLVFFLLLVAVGAVIIAVDPTLRKKPSDSLKSHWEGGQIILPDSDQDIGKKLYEEIKKRHPDTFIEPGFYNTMSVPYIYIAVPEEEWNSLTRADKISLCLYTKSLISILRSSPENYYPFLGFGDTPIVRTMYQKARATCDDCWAIMVGRVSDEYTKGTKDIILDETAVVGDPVYKAMKRENRAYSAVSFSDFCK